MPPLLRPSISTVNYRNVELWFVLQFIHWWVEYCGTLVDNSSLTSKFWVALIYSKIKKGIMHWSMIPVEFVPLIMMDGTSSVQSFDRACPTSMIERLISFLLSAHNFWLQWCSVVADIVYIFEEFSRNDSRPISFIRPVSTLHCQYIITHRVHCYTNINSNN